MKLKLLFIVASMFYLQASLAASLTSIPLSINSVETRRINDNLVRVIQHNMEFLPQIEIEVISTPELALLKKMVITEVMIPGEVIYFGDSAGTFIDSLRFDSDFILFSIEHFRKGKGGGEIQVDCKIDLKDGGLSEPVCIEKLQ